MTLGEYVGAREMLEAPVLVEHSRCGMSLGRHIAYCHEGEPDIIVIFKTKAMTTAAPSALRAAGHKPSATHRPRGGTRGQLTTPGVIAYAWSYEEEYQRVRCACLPETHIEKIRSEKVRTLPVTFPDWKWGRRIDLPVVTI